MTLEKAWHLLRQTAREFWTDNAMRLGAALSFYTALSLSPLLLVVIAIAGLLYGENAARGELVGQLQGLIGDEGARMIEQMLAASRQKSTGIWATIVGLVTLVVGATGVFAQLQDALNTVWNSKPEPSAGGIWRAVRDRLLSFSMVCGLAFLLLVSLVFSTLVGALDDVAHDWLPGSLRLVQAANFVLSLALMFLMFAMILKFLPRESIPWSDVWIGAGLTTILFAVGKHLIGLYLGQAAVQSTFGAAGSFVVLLLWIYYSSLIFLFGAEFTQVYSSFEGSRSGKAHSAKASETALISSSGESGPVNQTRPVSA
jgi:membrane protein